MKKPAAILFDLDGVIVDTEPSYTVFWHNAGEKYNVGIPDFANYIKGTTLSQILDTYFSEPDVRAEVEAALELNELQMQYRLFPGVTELLQILMDAGIPAAIVTSSNRRKMSNLWSQHRGLREMFADVITDEDVTRSKPDPQPYLVAAAKLGVNPCECIVVEDSYNGLKSGRAAGCKVVGLATTNPAETLLPLADVVYDSVDQLLLNNALTVL